MDVVRRLQRGASGWAVVMERWRASGLSVEAFCRRDVTSNCPASPVQRSSPDLVQVRSQRIVAEVLRPESRREFSDSAGGVLADALEDVDQVGVRIDAVKSAGGDQTLDDADVPGAQFGPTEQPVLSSHRNDAQRAFQMVGIDRHVGIGEEHFQPGPPLASVGQGSGERIAG